MDETTEEAVVEAPTHIMPPTRHDQAKAAHGAKVWTWIARFTGLALLAAVLGFGFYLATANASAREERADLPGMNGISVTGVSCVLQDDLSTAFRFTFSDASFVDVPGACLP